MKLRDLAKRLGGGYSDTEYPDVDIVGFSEVDFDPARTDGWGIWPGSQTRVGIGEEVVTSVGGIEQTHTVVISWGDRLGRCYTLVAPAGRKVRVEVRSE